MLGVLRVDQGFQVDREWERAALLVLGCARFEAHFASLQST